MYGCCWLISHFDHLHQAGVPLLHLLWMLTAKGPLLIPFLEKYHWPNWRHLAWKVKWPFPGALGATVDIRVKEAIPKVRSILWFGSYFQAPHGIRLRLNSLLAPPYAILLLSSPLSWKHPAVPAVNHVHGNPCFRFCFQRTRPKTMSRLTFWSWETMWSSCVPSNLIFKGWGKPSENRAATAIW